MGSANKVVSGAVWSMLLNVVNGIYGFIAVPILIRYFGKAEYGLIGLATSVNVYVQLMDMGFNSTNLRFFSAWLAKRNSDKIKKLFQTSLAFYGLIGLLNAIVLIVVSFFTPQLFHLTAAQDEIIKNLFYILAISALVSWFSSCFDQLIRATENVAWIQRRSLLPKLFQIVVLFLTIICKLSIEWYFVLTTFAAFIILPMSVNKIKKETPYVLFIPKFDIPTLKEMLPYALNIFSFSIFQFSFYNLRPVFLGIQGTVESVTDYRVMNGIVGFITMFSGVFLNALLPSSAKAVAQGNKDAYYRVAYDGTKYISIVLCFCAFGMMSISRDLLTIYVGESYLYLLPWLYMWLLCTLGSHNQAISSLILSGSDIRAISYSSMVASIVGLALSWILIPSFQIGGVVIAFAVYLAIQLGFYYLIYWPKFMKINSWRVFYYAFMPSVLIGLISFGICGFLPSVDEAWWNIIVKGSVFAVAFAILVYLTLNKQDKMFMKSVLSKGNK